MSSETWFSTEICLLLSLLMLHVIQAIKVVPTCEPGWFGTECQFRCLCTDFQCDRWGECLGGTQCMPGYFGPACQYGDIIQLTSLLSDVPLWVRDRKDDTCNPDSGLQDLVLAFSELVPLTWVRIVVSKLGFLESFDLKLNNSVACYNMRQAVVDGRTLDIYCDMDSGVQNLTLTGEGVSYLCTVHVSLGRDVASRASALDTSIQLHEDLRTVFLTDNENEDKTIPPDSNSLCMSTSSPCWSHNLRTPHILSAILLMRRNVEHSSKITLDMFDGNGQLVSSCEAKNKHNHIFLVTPHPVSLVSMTAPQNHSLNLCEIFIFGEMQCDEGQFGLSCSAMCPCAANKTEICHTSTGICVGSCPPGLYGFNCSMPCPKTCSSGLCASRYGDCIDRPRNKRDPQNMPNSNQTDVECHIGFYGKDCKTPCPVKCNWKCDQMTGVCLPCDRGFYGTNCSKRCATACVNSMCYQVTGYCYQCESYKYGNFCENSCGANCYLFECNSTTGQCFSCAPGYKGETCSLVPWNVTLFVILLFLIPSVIACFFCCEVLSSDEKEGVDKDNVSTEISHQDSVV